MSLAQDLLDLCNDQIQWNPLASRDSYGVPTFTPGQYYPARFVKKNKQLRIKDKQQVTSTGQVWVMPSLTSGVPFPNIKPFDQVKLSDGTTPQILDTQIFQDEEFEMTGEPAYTVVYFV